MLHRTGGRMESRNLGTHRSATNNTIAKERESDQEEDSDDEHVYRPIATRMINMKTDRAAYTSGIHIRMI